MKKKLVNSLSKSKLLINKSLTPFKNSNTSIKNSQENEIKPYKQNIIKANESKILKNQQISSQKNYDQKDFFSEIKNKIFLYNKNLSTELIKGTRFFNKIMSSDRKGHILRILDSFDREHIEIGNNIPLDLHLRKYYLKFKFVPSQDREFISDQVYNLIRYKGLVDFLAKPPLNWFSRFDAYYDSTFESQKNNVNIPNHLRVSFPKEIFDLVKNSFGAENAMKYCSVMNERAPLTIRTNIIKVTRDELYNSLKNKGFDIIKTEYSPYGITFKTHPKTNFFSLDEYKQGHFEVQDEGSQLPGDLILDYCGGSGGKSLAIAPFTMAKGQIFLHDIRKHILLEAKKRLRRAGVQNYQLVNSKDNLFQEFKGKFDWILLDVPCSGSGTLRRNPDLKWKFSYEKLEEYINVQEKIFEESLRLLKPNGRIVYITCSLFQEENMDQIIKFGKKFGVKIENNSVFQTIPTSRKMDGFFSVTLTL